MTQQPKHEAVWITLQKLRPKQWRVYFYNGANLGEIERDVDGFFKFWPSEAKGGYVNEPFFEAYNEIHTIIKALNGPYEREITKFFNETAIEG